MMKLYMCNKELAKKSEEGVGGGREQNCEAFAVKHSLASHHNLHCSFICLYLPLVEVV